MDPEPREYEGHRIELRARKKRRPRRREPGEELELLIDEEPVSYGQLPDGSFFLEEYAYDRSDNLIDLAERFIDFQRRAEQIRGRGREAGEGE